MSVDGNVKVPIGVTAVIKQAPIIMHVSFEIRSPDHDFVKGTKHNLRPSAYAACEIKPPSSRADSEINYSDLPRTATRSGKHDPITAYIHDREFDHLLELKLFDKIVKHGNVLKPTGMSLPYSILRNSI